MHVAFRSFLITFVAICALHRMAAAQETVCATVRIEIQQELTLERQGFDARMRIDNGLDTLPIDNVDVDVFFTDEDGNSVVATSDPSDTSASFFIRVDSLDGIADIDGGGSIGPASDAEIHWLIVPAPGTGGQLSSGRLYFVGASLSYTLGGETELIEVSPDYIFVKPQPLLTLDYFLTREVFADDAFTSEIEPAEPFTLGVRVKNNGQGVTRDLAIESGQPRIVENEQGLLIDFRITGGFVDDRPASPSLAIELGDLPPGESVMGRWTMVTTLSGEFVAFDAEYTHSDELGGELTSLLEAVNTHFLVHDVRVDLPGRDAVRDFLAMDGDVLRVYESSGVDTEVTDQSAQATLAVIGQSGDQVRHALQAPPTAGFFYVRLPDPHRGQKGVVRALRSDGKELLLDNVWLSRSRADDKRSFNYFVNVLDTNSTGRYEIVLGDLAIGPRPPAMQFIPDRSTYENRRISFLVEASDPDGTVPGISAAPLPAGAVLFEQSDGVAIFDWVPSLGQRGIYPITFTASDGTLETSQTARITVRPFVDEDGDGMSDDWELRHFGTLDRDGTRDFDGDGISDLDEFLRGSDPTVPEGSAVLVPGFNLLSYPVSDPETQPATCRALLQAIGGEDEVVSIARFDAALGRYQACDRVSGDDFDLAQGEAYAVRMRAPRHLELPEGGSCPAVSLAAGLNLFGHPAPPAGLSCYRLLNALGSGVAVLIQRFDQTLGAFETCVFHDPDGAGPRPMGIDFPIVAGEGYQVFTRGPITLTLPGCDP